MEKFRSRKFGVVVFVLCTSSIALFTGYVSGAEWAMISSTSVGAYSMANAWESRK